MLTEKQGNNIQPQKRGCKRYAHCACPYKFCYRVVTFPMQTQANYGFRSIDKNPVAIGTDQGFLKIYFTRKLKTNS